MCESIYYNQNTWKLQKLVNFKTDIDGAVSCNSLYDDCFEKCESRGIDTPEFGVNAKRKQNENSTITNEKETFS
jgi:hypothetical protein